MRRATSGRSRTSVSATTPAAVGHDAAVGAGHADVERRSARARSTFVGRCDRQRRRDRLRSLPLHRGRCAAVSRRSRRRAEERRRTSDTGLTAATSYSYEVRAVDAAGNLGPFSNTASAPTAGGELERPRRGLRLQRRNGHDGHGRIRQRQRRHDREHDLDGRREVRRRALIQRDERAGQHPELGVVAAESGMTLEAWVNPSTTSSGWRDVIYKGNDNYYLEGNFRQWRQSRRRRHIRRRATGMRTAPAPLTAGAWSYLALTYDGATLRLYVNGTLVGSQARTGAIATSTNPLQIGGDGLYGQYFAGLIDEVRIYNVPLRGDRDPGRHGERRQLRRCGHAAPDDADEPRDEQRRPDVGDAVVDGVDRQRRRDRLPALPRRRQGRDVDVDELHLLGADLQHDLHAR